MTKNQINLTEWLKRQAAGAYASEDTPTQIEAGWYDWFCRDTSLAGKTKRLAPKVARIAKSPKINPDEVYVWFKNNCPMSGSLYDDFRIADLETGATLYTITPRSGHFAAKGQAEVWSRADNDFAEPVVQGTWSDVLTYFEVR